MRYTYLLPLLFITSLAFSQQPSFTNSLQFSSKRVQQLNSLSLPDFSWYSKNYYEVFKDNKAFNNAFYTADGSYYQPYADVSLSFNNAYFQKEPLGYGIAHNDNFNATTVLSALAIEFLGDGYEAFAKKMTFTYSSRKKATR